MTLATDCRAAPRAGPLVNLFPAPAVLSKALRVRRVLAHGKVNKFTVRLAAIIAHKAHGVAVKRFPAVVITADQLFSVGFDFFDFHFVSGFAPVAGVGVGG